MENQIAIWSVSDVNKAVKDLLENSLMPFYLKGEVGSLLIHSSGHVYMVLKDKKCQIKATFFGGAAEARRCQLKNGDEIEVFGRLSVYDVRGEYQFNIRKMNLAGAGDLQRRFEEIKRRLFEEGLFAESRKKPIPVFPGKIGVISSPSGAAVRDFLQIVTRRFPNLNVKIYPSLMQGNNTANEVMNGIDFFNRTKCVEVIVITRGGGSMEDLWPFNDENLARKIAASQIPVISAIGHEIDFTIADFAADLRVPTPSAAAELAVKSKLEVDGTLLQLEKDMKNTLNIALTKAQNQLQRLASHRIFHETFYLVETQNRRLDELTLRLANAIKNTAKNYTAKIDLIQSKLNAVNPFLLSRRGYVMLFDQSNKLVKSAKVPSGTPLCAKMADGDLKLHAD